MKINTLFKKICKLLALDDQIFEEKIADFFEMLSTDKRFVMVEKGYWDLQENHSRKIIIDDEDEDIVIEKDEEVLDEEDIFYEGEDNDDEAEDDLKDLVIIDDEDQDALQLFS